MKNLIQFENFSQHIKEAEVAISEDPKPEGPDEKLFTAQGQDRAQVKRKAHDEGRGQGYTNITSKSKLTGTTDASGNPGAPYTYKVVMSKSLPKN